MHCPHCDEMLPDDATACPACRADVSAASPAPLAPVPDTPFDRVSALLAAGKLPEALAACKTAIVEQPENGDLYLALGDCLRAGNNLRGAMDAYRHAVQLGGSRLDLARERLDHIIDALHTAVVGEAPPAPTPWPDPAAPAPAAPPPAVGVLPAVPPPAVRGDGVAYPTVPTVVAYAPASSEKGGLSLRLAVSIILVSLLIAVLAIVYYLAGRKPVYQPAPRGSAEKISRLAAPEVPGA